MLKSHQIRRLIEKQTTSRLPDYSYLGCARAHHYILVSQDGGVRRLLSLYLNGVEKQLEARFGVSYLGSPGAICLAPFLTVWRELSLPDREFSSKKSARRALELFFRNFDPAIHTQAAMLERDLEPMSPWHAFLNRYRHQLNEGEPSVVEELKRSAPQDVFLGLLAVARLGEDEPADEEELESLLDSLAGEGSYQATSEFTLDRTKALQKLSDFQLGEPVLFPLFLAVGLSLLGASHLEIEIDSDETWVRYQGVSIEKGELQELSSVLLASQLSERQIGWDFLAKGLLQAARREPTTLTLEAGSLFDLREFPEDFIETHPGEPDSKGTFYCRTSFGVQVLKRFVGSLRREHPEVSALKAALQYLSVPWSLNGEQYKGQIELGSDEIGLLFLSEEVPPVSVVGGDLKVEESPVPATVLVVLRPEPSKTLTTVLHQMVVELPDSVYRPEIDVLAWLPHMALDLSGRKLVDSQLLHEICAALPGLEARVWAHLREVVVSGSREKRMSLQRTVLERLEQGWNLPILPQVESGWTSPSEFREVAQFYTTGSFEKALRSGQATVEVNPAVKRAFLRHFPDAVDVTVLLEKTAFYYAKLEEWLAMEPAEAELQNCAPEWAIQMESGWVGLSELRQPGHQLLCQGRPLPAQLLNRWVPPYVELALFDDGLEMDDDWVVVSPQQTLETIQVRVLRSLKSLLDRFKPEHLEQETSRNQFGYLLAFLRKHGVSFTRREKERWDMFLSASDLDLDRYRN